MSGAQCPNVVAVGCCSRFGLKDFAGRDFDSRYLDAVFGIEMLYSPLVVRLLGRLLHWPCGHSGKSSRRCL